MQHRRDAIPKIVIIGTQSDNLFNLPGAESDDCPVMERERAAVKTGLG
jgi:hypothetical protein